MPVVDESNRRLDPLQNIKEITGDSGVIDMGDRSKTYIVDTDETSILKIIGSNYGPRETRGEHDLLEAAASGQDGKRFQKKQLELSDGDGDLSSELEALLDSALANTDITTGEANAGASVYLVGGLGEFDSVTVAIVGEWSVDYINLSGKAVDQWLGANGGGLGGDGGNFGVADTGEKGVDYAFDTDQIEFVKILDNKYALSAFTSGGQDQKNFQNGQLGLVDVPAGGVERELDVEQFNLLEAARLDPGYNADGIALLDQTDTSIKVGAVGENGNIDTFTFTGALIEQYIDDVFA